MIEASADPGPAKAQVPSSAPSPTKPSWSGAFGPRIAALFTADRVTAAFTVVLAAATLALVGTAWFQHNDAVEAIKATERLAQATENAAKDRQKISSAELILKFNDMLESPHYTKIVTDIESHGSNTPWSPERRKVEATERTLMSKST